MMMEINYLDWNNAIDILNKAHETRLFALIIGPKGTGKQLSLENLLQKQKKSYTPLTSVFAPESLIL